ncbi:MAG: hypothetical protein IPI35_16830 [Deltaproteobacteria bacterium]|nr:hypothetical protein [Deltaproteobacteria bacterium]
MNEQDPQRAQTEAETRDAARFALGLMALAALFFGVLSLGYGLRAPFVELGREGTVSWMFWKLDTLDTAALRAHPGGRVMWLVGSSVIRESFDEALVNQGLAERGSVWRVQKFGFNRGAAGLAAGLVAELPIEPGDTVVHNVSVGNLRADWLSFANIPEERLVSLLTAGELLGLKELSAQEKLSALVMIPEGYWRFRNEHMNGLTRLFAWPIWGGEFPTPKTKSYNLTFRTLERERKSPRSFADPTAYRLYQDLERTDLSPEQINTAGLARMRRLCEDRGAALLLIDVPPTRLFQSQLMSAELRAVWDVWREEQGVHYFPQIPDDDYFDLIHPNFRGRAALTPALVDWIEDPQRGAPTPLGDWTPPTHTPGAEADLGLDLEAEEEPE